MRHPDSQRVSDEAPGTPASMEVAAVPPPPGADQVGRPEEAVVVVPSVATAPPPVPGQAPRPPVDPRTSQVHVNRPALDLVIGRRPEEVPALEAGQQRDLDHIVHQVLVVGLVFSVVLFLVGIGLDLFRQNELPTVIPSPIVAFHRALELRPSGFLALGLVVLVATPVLRVVGSFLVFLYQRDWRYAAITAIVLVIMIISVRTGAG